MSIEPSAELDLRVAKACGWRGKIVGSDFHRLDEDAPVGEKLPVFRPSTDLNDTFLAAEKFGLFDPARHWLSLCQSDMDDLWTFTTLDGTWLKQIDRQSTAALAICAAILKITEKT